MAIFKGAGVAIVTPMKEDGSIDYDVYGRLIDWQIENGTDAIVAVGTSGGRPSTTTSISRPSASRRSGRLTVCRSSPAPGRTTRPMP